MNPFDPSLEFEAVVLQLNEDNYPGSTSSGKTRNSLLWAWALFAGRSRAESEIAAAVERHGSIGALLGELRMTRGTFKAFRSHVASLTERYTLPQTGYDFRMTFATLSPAAQVDVATVAADLLREPDLLHRLANGEGPNPTRLLESALRAAELRRAVAELAQMLDSGVVHERCYQDWCDAHSWAFGGAHQLRDIERRIDKGSIVDLLLPDVVGYRDIVELKRPDFEALKYDRSHQTYYFSTSAAKAVGQVHKYMDRLHDLARGGLHKSPHIVAYHPRATIVIGRSQAWSAEKTRALRGLNERLHGIELMTYDHLLQRARTILSNHEQTP